MAEQIPGRKIGPKEAYFTDWVPRTGDSMLLHAETVIRETGNVKIVVQTRAEPGPGAASTPSTVYDITPTYKTAGSGNNLELQAVGIESALFLATAAGESSGTPNSLQAFVRLKVSYMNDETGYQVIRIFPFTFFDNAKP